MRFSVQFSDEGTLLFNIILQQENSRIFEIIDDCEGSQERSTCHGPAPCQIYGSNNVEENIILRL